MASGSPEAYAKAHQFIIGGPLLPRNEPPERLALLALAYGLAYPQKEALNLGCSGCIARGFMQLQYWYNNATPPPTAAPGPDAQESQTTISTIMKKAPRYTFRDSNTQYRAFGDPSTTSRETLTDEKAAAIIAADPSAVGLFYDSEAPEVVEVLAAAGLVEAQAEADQNARKEGTQSQLASPSEVRQMTKAQLETQYALEVGTAPDLAELNTNPKLVEAIIAFREKQAE